MSSKTLAALLLEAELYQYYESFCNTLKVTTVEQLKYVQEEDLQGIGFSKPEIRRLQKYQQKHQKHPYLKKLKKLAYLPVHKHHKNTSDLPAAHSSTNFITSYDGSKHIISASQISIQKQLGSGEFGTVQQGIWSNGNERIQVAVKCLNKANVQTNPMEFLKEAAIMHAIEHDNIVRLYGVVLDTDSSLWLVSELAHLRSLLECLKDSELRTTLLNVSTLCDYILQISNGMAYLEGKRLIHRDLAARNILVFSKNLVKISDFGLSRALNVGKTYYQTNFNVNLKLPIAWSSPESINFLRFTTASDVWSFGVCAWEIFSYGFQPWAGMTGQQILEAIDEPQFSRLEQPECCPKDYYDLMLRCWEHVPSKRPAFYEICRILPKITPKRVETLKGKSDSSNEMLNYRCKEQITVLDYTTFSPFWKGITDSGKTGLFDPTFCGAVNVGDYEQVTKKKSKLPYIFGVYSSNTLESNKTKRDGLSCEDQEQLIPLTPTSIQNPSFDQESLVSDFTAKCAHEYYEIYPALANWNSFKKISNGGQAKCVFNNDCGLDFVKTISEKDEKILEQAIEIANKINSKSITLRLTNDISGRKKSGLKLISKVNNHSFDCTNPSNHADPNSINVLDHRHDVKTFSDELKKSPDLQSTITAESREAYNNLVDNPIQCNSQSSTLKLPHQQRNDYDLSDIFKNNLDLNDIRNMNLDKTENNDSGHGNVSNLRNCDCESLYNGDDMRTNLMNNGCINTSNTLPLPPRPKKLPMVTKRHVRIHPLKMTNKLMTDHDYEGQKYLEVKSDNSSPTELNCDGSKDRMNHFALFKINNPITASEEVEHCKFISNEIAKSPNLE